jgi:prepilin-type N-terminal cleavage/methylation domain-containing protein
MQMFNSYYRSSREGFTLVELLVVIIILVTLMVGLFLVFNPLAQINKIRDAQRKQDLAQIRSAVDTYFNDNGCYPQSVPFGGAWTVGPTVYMKKVPQDPDCGSGGYCYIYQTDANSACPQWNVLYAHLVQKMTATQLLASCPLRTVCSIIKNINYNYCILSGTIDCNYMKTAPFPSGSLSPTPTSTSGPTPIPTGTIDCNGHYYAVSPFTGNCDDLGNDSGNFCSIHGGTQGYYCYSEGAAPGTNSPCTGFLCSH